MYGDDAPFDELKKELRQAHNRIEALATEVVRQGTVLSELAGRLDGESQRLSGYHDTLQNIINRR